MPTLVVHGEQDVIVPIEIGKAVASAISTSELVALPDTGHVPTLTRPRELVEAINSWAATIT